MRAVFPVHRRLDHVIALSRRSVHLHCSNGKDSETLGLELRPSVPVNQHRQLLGLSLTFVGHILLRQSWTDTGRPVNEAPELTYDDPIRSDLSSLTEETWSHRMSHVHFLLQTIPMSSCQS